MEAEGKPKAAKEGGGDADMTEGQTAAGAGKATCAPSMARHGKPPYASDLLSLLFFAATVPSFVLPPNAARAWVEALGLRIEAFDAGYLPFFTESYRFFTATLLHRSVNHLVSSVVMMHLFSQEAERDLGPKRFLAVFMGGSIVAFLTQMFFRFNAGTLQMGASGGIAAAMGAFLANCRKTDVPSPGNLSREFVSRFLIRFLCAAWFSWNVWSAVTGTGSAGVAWWAHIAGFGFGIAAKGAYEARDAKDIACAEKTPPVASP